MDGKIGFQKTKGGGEGDGVLGIDQVLGLQVNHTGGMPPLTGCDRIHFIGQVKAGKRATCLS